MNIQNLSERVKEYISLRHEGETLDFKRQWYENDDRGKADLLHDIICMANTIEDEDGAHYRRQLSRAIGMTKLLEEFRQQREKDAMV